MGVTGVVIGCAFGIGVGLAMLFRAFAGSRNEAVSGKAHSSSHPSRPPTWWLRRFGPAVAVAALVVFATRWPVAGLVAGLAAFGLPSLLGQTASSRSTAKVEAIATWTELLRDTLAAAAGLSQAIMATAEIAPGAIHARRRSVRAHRQRDPAGRGPAAVRRRGRRRFGRPGRRRPPVAASARAQRLVDLLSAALADSIRQDVAMRLRVESGRAAARSGVRTIVVFSLAFAGVLALVAHSYLAPSAHPSARSCSPSSARSTPPGSRSWSG